VPNAFQDQTITLTVLPPRILFGNARHPHHAPHFRLAAQIRHQRAQQTLGVNPIRLYPSRPPVHLQARRINNGLAGLAWGFRSSGDSGHGIPSPELDLLTQCGHHESEDPGSADLAGFN
jgi:hypothetical protein